MKIVVLLAVLIWIKGLPFEERLIQVDDFVAQSLMLDELVENLSGSSLDAVDLLAILILPNDDHSLFDTMAPVYPSEKGRIQVAIRILFLK